MIKLTIALPLTDELNEECKFLNVDDGKAPAEVVRYAAMQGVSLAAHKLTRAQHDWGTMHFTFEPVNASEFVTLPVIPFTEDNYDPLHGPAQVWWVSMMRAGAMGPNILEPAVVEQVKAALGGLDLTGKEVHCVNKSFGGYQITIRRDVLLGRPSAKVEKPEPVAPKVAATEDNAPSTSSGTLARAVDSVLDSLTLGSIGSLLD